MTSLLCETVTGRTMAELVANRDAVSEADMVELRMDGVTDVDVAQALAGRRTPTIVTCRPSWEGGRFTGSEEERGALLGRALGLGAEYVDVEWQALRNKQEHASFDRMLHADAARVIVSSHDFTGVPGDLCTRARAMRGTGAAVIKVAVTAARLSDTLPLLDIAREGNAVVIGMGAAGVPSRLLASRFGSRWTYGGRNVAPGQMPSMRMVQRFRFKAVRSTSAIYGVVGNNVMGSVSPAMHNAAFEAAALDAVYVPLPAADIDDFLTFADALGIAGASVTIPFKIDALRIAKTADDVTRRVGAANTLRRGGHGWDATNTDVPGFLEPLLEIIDEQDLAALRVSVLGAGGAARAVIVALNSHGARVTVHARRQSQAAEVAAAFGVDAGPWPPDPDSWDVLVNCTPLGRAPWEEVSPVPGGPFDGRVVYDLVYRVGTSPLLREARSAGCTTLNGLSMLVAQAERQYQWWTGQRPVPDVMPAAAAADLNQIAGIESSVN